jgi:alpha-galactosidase
MSIFRPRRLAALVGATLAVSLGCAKSESQAQATPTPVASGCPDVAASAVSPSADLARTPPMGWNSWNKFGCNVSESLVRETADAIASGGMKDAGYELVVIDDCWQTTRDASGTIVADSRRFPSGMKALADYVHDRGLRFGLYSDAGTLTCGGRPGSRCYEVADARQYAAWGVDYLKFDWCNTEGMTAPEAYAKMRRALDAAGRPIVLSICEWGGSQPWRWARGIGHLWRTTGDIADCWDCERQYSRGWLRLLDAQVGLETYAGPGGWNDPDMLEVGNGGMTTAEYRAHFSLWCLLAAPLMAGNDVRNMSPEIRDILTNKEVIGVDQDALGRQGARIRDDGDLEVWAKDLTGGARAVVLFNRGTTAASLKVSWAELGLGAGASLKVRDLWAKKDLGVFTGSHEAPVPAHDVVMLRVQE